jgi:hypothetical protein
MRFVSEQVNPKISRIQLKDKMAISRLERIENQTLEKKAPSHKAWSLKT